MHPAGTLIRSDEAMQFIETIDDPITRNLVNMAFVRVVQRQHLERQEPPVGDFDLLYLVAALRDFFSEPEILARALAGEKVGAWFEDVPEPVTVSS